jgi:hypothetical protein
MKRSLLIVVVLVTATALSAFGQGQDGDRLGLGLFLPFDFNGGGARAQGMGGAYYGLSDDITAGTWNPAGLTAHEGPTLALSYGGLLGDGHADVSLAGNPTTYRREHDGSLGSVTDAIFVAPFRLRGHPFVGNFSYSKNFDGLTNWGYESTFTRRILTLRQNIYQVEEFAFQSKSSAGGEGAVRSINIGFGTRIHGNTSMGATVNVYTGESVRESFNIATLPQFPLEPFEQDVRIDINTSVIDTSEFSGVNFTLGFKHSGDRMNAGLVIKTPFDLQVETGSSIYTIRSVNTYPTEEGTDTTFIDDQVVKYGMPLMVGAGLAYSLSDELVLAMDAEYRGFGSSKIKERDVLEITPGGNINEVFSEYDPEWNSGIALRFGGEYQWDQSFGMIPLRAGVAFTPTPRPSSEDVDTPTMSYVLPSLVLSPVAKLLNKDDTPLMYSVSLGTGIHWSQIHLDWSYSYSQIDRNLPEVTGQFLLQNRDHHIAFTFTGIF